MEHSSFLQRVDAIIRKVEDWLEDFDPDEVDFETADGLIKIQFPGGPTFVLNRQKAADQIWYAAGDRAWHYNLDDASGEWRSDKDNHELFGKISETVSRKIGRTVTFSPE